MLSLKQRIPPKGKTAPYSTCFPRDEGDSDPSTDSGLQCSPSSGLARDEATTRRYKPSGFRNHEEKPGWGLGTPGLFTTRQGSQQHSSPPARPWGPHRGHRPPSPRAGPAAAPGPREEARTQLPRDRHVALGRTPPCMGHACGGRQPSSGSGGTRARGKRLLETWRACGVGRAWCHHGHSLQKTF